MSKELTDAEVKVLTELSYKKAIKKGNKMSKELTPLEALEKLGKLNVEKGLRIKPSKTIVSDYIYYKIIETALKNYVELTNKPVILYGRTHGHTQALIDTICKNYKEVKITNLEDEKKLKAFEIIKNKKVNILAIYRYESINKYNSTMECFLNPEMKLTQKEYDLLKEVLL